MGREKKLRQPKKPEESAAPQVNRSSKKAEGSAAPQVNRSSKEAPSKKQGPSSKKETSA